MFCLIQMSVTQALRQTPALGCPSLSRSTRSPERDLPASHVSCYMTRRQKMKKQNETLSPYILQIWKIKIPCECPSVSPTTSILLAEMRTQKCKLLW